MVSQQKWPFAILDSENSGEIFIIKHLNQKNDVIFQIFGQFNFQGLKCTANQNVQIGLTYIHWKIRTDGVKKIWSSQLLTKTNLHFRTKTRYLNFLIFFFLFSVPCWVHINDGDEYEVNGTLAVNAPGDYPIHQTMQF